MAVRRANQHGRQRLRQYSRRLAFETLDARELLATLTVGPAGQHATIQAAINNASPGDIISIAQTPVDGGFQESINLSLMGSALPGGGVRGSIAIIGDPAGTGTTIIAPGGSTIFNSAPFTGSVRIENLTLRAEVATAGEDMGINLDNITGDITIKNVQVVDSIEAGIEITNSGGASGAQSKLLIDQTEVRRNADGLTNIGMRLANLRMIGTLSDNQISDVLDVGLIIEASGATQTVLLVDANTISSASNETIVGNDGIRVGVANTAQLDLALFENTFDGLPGNSIDAIVSDSATMNVNMYGRNAVSNSDGQLRIANEPAVRFTSQGSAKMALSVDDNIFTTLATDALHVQALGTSLVNARIYNNFMPNIGTANDHDAIVIFGNASSNATVNASIQLNDIVQAFGSAIRVLGNGTSTYNVRVMDNFISDVEPLNQNVGSIEIRGIAGNLSKLNLAVMGNRIQPAFGRPRTAGIFVFQASSQVDLKAEFTGGNPQNYFSNQVPDEEDFDSTDTTVSFNASAQIDVIRVAPGTFLPRMPLPIGDFVWSETTRNGTQDTNEAGVEGALLRLTGTETASGLSVTRAAISDASGGYQFGAMLPGTYTVTITSPNGEELTNPNQTTPATNDVDDEVDSDFNTTTRQATVTLLSGQSVLHLDAGLLAPSPWKNATRAQDVNNDGLVTPLDALLVIIDLNSNGPRLLTSATPFPPFIDVNGDGAVAPLDALLVIIELNSGGGGEGEPPAATPAAANDSGAAPYLPPEFLAPSGKSSSSEEEDAADPLDLFFAGMGE